MSLSRVRVVLVRPKSGGNVGAVARAMKNMGVGDLVVVAPRDPDRGEAERMAVHATDVLDGMRVVEALGDAVADCSWVVGTTARGGAYRSRPLDPREAAGEILRVAGRDRVALLFGPEDTGLENEDLKACDELVRIPTHSAYVSLNVAQAVLVCLYELFVAEHPPEPAPTALATSERMELLFRKLERILLDVGYLPEDNPDHIMFTVRRIFGRARMEARELRVWLGIASQLEWYLEGGAAVVEEKRRRGEKLK